MAVQTVSRKRAGEEAAPAPPHPVPCHVPEGMSMTVTVGRGRRTRLGRLTVSLQADGMLPVFKPGRRLYARTRSGIRAGDDALVLTMDGRLYLRRVFPTQKGLTLRAYEKGVKAVKIPTRAILFVAPVTSFEA